MLKFGGRVYHGADCLNMLSLLSSRSGLFNWLMAVTFARPGIAHMAYPTLRAGRNASLRLLGRRQIHEANSVKTSRLLVAGAARAFFAFGRLDIFPIAGCQQPACGWVMERTSVSVHRRSSALPSVASALATARSSRSFKRGWRHVGRNPNEQCPCPLHLQRN